MKFAQINDFCRISGLGRTTVYYRLADGCLRAVKVGKRTLIDVDAGLAWIASQPPAVIRCGRKAA